MKKPLMIAAAVAIVSSLALAQGPGYGTGGEGKGPGYGSGGKYGPEGKGGKGPGWRFGSSNTRGWSLMTPAERAEHRQKMLSMKTVADCKAFLEEHRKLMESRAKEQGKPVPPGPRQDMCERMKQAGRLS